MEGEAMNLNLDCSNALLPRPWINVDIVPPADQIADLNERWPWADGAVDQIRAHDIIEHLRSPIHTMNEAFRVLKPGGVLDIVVPTTDGRGAWQDPGHVSFWNRNSFFYFEAGNAHLTRFAPANGVRCAFAIASAKEEMIADKVSKLHIVLKAVKC
jgi:SAM-dependent methyltransferase